MVLGKLNEKDYGSSLGLMTCCLISRKFKSPSVRFNFETEIFNDYDSIAIQTNFKDIELG
jgi:hypothetical protein